MALATPNLDLVLIEDSDNLNTAVRVHMNTNAQILSARAHVVSKTAAYTATADDHMILVDASAGPVTISLPTAVGERGREYVVKKTDASANAVTVDPNGAQTIDGAATYVLSEQHATIWVRSDDANWQALVVASGSSGTIPSGNLAFTGLAQRITGDMSHATRSNRLALQNSVVNANTNVPVLPNGTATSTALQLHNAADSNNAGWVSIFCTPTSGGFTAQAAGSGTAPATMAFTGFVSGYSFDHQVLTPASTTARASLRVPSGTAPTTPVAGDLWFDGTNLKFRDAGGTTRTLTWT